MKHKQKKDELESDRFLMVAALAAIKRHRLLVNYNHELNSKIRNYIPSDTGVEILKDIKCEQQETEVRMSAAAKDLQDELKRFKKN